MKNRSILILVFITFFASSCKRDSIDVDPNRVNTASLKFDNRIIAFENIKIEETELGPSILPVLPQAITIQTFSICSLTEGSVIDGAFSGTLRSLYEGDISVSDGSFHMDFATVRDY